MLYGSMVTTLCTNDADLDLALVKKDGMEVGRGQVLHDPIFVDS